MKKVFILTLISIISFASQAQMTYLKATLEGGQEVPPTASTASGVTIVKYNTATRLLELTGDYQNLTASATAAHIHSPAPVGSNAPVLIPLTHSGGTSGTLTGSATLTAVQETDLLAGNMYVNVHNANYPGGEIRGQLTTTTAGQTEYMTGRIQGAQEVPPNGSQATGTVTTLLDKTTNMVYLTGSFSGLSAAASASHIHKAAPRTNGPIFINISFTPATSGTLHIAGAISDPDEAEMMNGNAYVNIHNAIYPGGEIRGQLTQLNQNRFLKAVLQGSQEVPPTPSAARGTVIIKYNTTNRLLELTGDYQDLATAATAAHIHSPAPVGTNAGVLIPLTQSGGTSGTLTGSATLTEAQESDLFAGLMYVNVHNANYPGGEIRGQLSATTAGQTEYLTGTLTGSQEVPANSSAATGNVTVILDKTTNEVFLTGSFSGLTLDASAAHIHRGAAGTNGPVVVPLSPTTSASGTITGNATVSDAFKDSMIAGNTYVNIHNAEFPGGEIRAQLGNLVLPVKFKYFNGFKQSNKITLVWESSQEENLSHYEVEQQDEPGNWINKATLLAKGGNGAAKYSWTDDPLVVKNGYVIYRLKMVDLNKTFTYSSALKLNFEKLKAELFITTNPVLNGQLKFKITGFASDKKVQVSVIDYAGRTLLQKATSSFMSNTLNLTQLPAGMYRLMIRVDDIILQKSFSK